jgi:hypothetical protein
MLLAALAVTGCANDRSADLAATRWGPVSYLGGGINVVSMAVAAGGAAPSAETPTAMRKTLGGKVLSAMALERVTGRKPDPSRLNEID